MKTWSFWGAVALACLAAGTRTCAQNTTCAVSVDPTIQAAEQRSQISLANHQFVKVVKDLRPLVAAHPEACELTLLLGKAYLDSKQDRNAKRQFLSVLGRDPKNRTAKLNLALIYGYHSKYKQSNLLYRELLRADPTDEQSSIGLAGNQIRMQRFHEAKATVEAGLSAHPNSIRLQEDQDTLAATRILIPPRPADVQAWLYLITDSAGDRVT